ncbi:MAG: aspartyl/asparaginyl beta-hydroxylase domain-containing protein [Saprospiraceae bacterium]|nr:aspartyl/asparaginyl beta-hydroxylase domain-containing protein [Saprospiraceae bacterium]
MKKFFQLLAKKYFWFHFRLFGKYSYLGIEQIIRKASLVGDHPFYAKDQFPWVKDIESNWLKIRAELEEVMRNGDSIPNFLDVSPGQYRIDNEPGKWKTFFLYGYGYKVEANIARCPETARLVEQIPGMKTAFFSILAPGKHIPPHRGPYAGVLRYHLGLIVPDPEKIRIRVHNEIGHWHEGDSLIFDDTYEHEVWNDSNGTRVVLFVDFVRPLDGFAKKLNDRIVNMISKSPLVQESIQAMEKVTERR